MSKPFKARKRSARQMERFRDENGNLPLVSISFGSEEDYLALMAEAGLDPNADHFDNPEEAVQRIEVAMKKLRKEGRS